MVGAIKPNGFESIVVAVRDLVVARLDALADSVGWANGAETLFSGKMLRTRLAARLGAQHPHADIQPIVNFCAATELLHLASLCHDDVIDNALLRRHQDALWVSTGPSAAVLMGDMILCEALELVRSTRGGCLTRSFLAKAREVLHAEIQQEILYRGQGLDQATCLRLARGKTGPLFAFPASACGGDDASLTAALEEAGYRIGAAYQLADDLIDVAGDEQAVGKTLGTDAARGKFTIPQLGPEGPRITRSHIEELCGGALACLSPWPGARGALTNFLVRDLWPALGGLQLPRSLALESAT